MTEISGLEVWFLTGSQHLYGDEALKQVAANSRTIAESLAAEKGLPVKVVFKPVLTRPEEVRDAVPRGEHESDNCIGLVLWMHTFSPAKMWIAGLTPLRKPFVHLHTQFERGAAVEHDRYGLHEPEPVGAWRPRVRAYYGAPAPAAQGGGGVLAGCRDGGGDWCVDARGAWAGTSRRT